MFGADGGTRTRTGLPPTDFKSVASTGSATSAAASFLAALIRDAKHGEHWRTLRPETVVEPSPGAVGRAPHLCPITAADVGHAAVALKELVGHLEDREHEAALRAPSRVAAPRGAPDEITRRYREASIGTFSVHQLALEYVGLLDLDVLMVGEHGAGRKAHQGGHEAAVAIKQQRLHFATGKPRLLPLHFAHANVVGFEISWAEGLGGHGIHRILLREHCHDSLARISR